MTRWSMRTQFPHVQKLQSPAEEDVTATFDCVSNEEA